MPTKQLFYHPKFVFKNQDRVVGHGKMQSARGKGYMYKSFLKRFFDIIRKILNIKTICLEGIMMNHVKLFVNHLKKVIFENTHHEITLIVNQYLSEAPALGASLKTINQNLEQIIFSKKVLLDGEVKH